MIQKNKYRNVKVVVDSVSFASKKEAARYVDLRLLEKAGSINDLQHHPVYKLSAGGRVIGKIIPDFQYIENGALVCEDVKSTPTITAIFRWKAKHLLYEHGIAIKIVS